MKLALLTFSFILILSLSAKADSERSFPEPRNNQGLEERSLAGKFERKKETADQSRRLEKLRMNLRGFSGNLRI